MVGFWKFTEIAHTDTVPQVPTSKWYVHVCGSEGSTQSPEYIKGELVCDHWFKSPGLIDRNKQLRNIMDPPFKRRPDGCTLTEVYCWFRYWPWRCCRCQDVSYSLIDIQLIPPTAHTWYVMRMEKCTVSISEICLCVSVCVHVCLLDGIWINGHACYTAVNTEIVGMIFSVR